MSIFLKIFLISLASLIIWFLLFAFVLMPLGQKFLGFVLLGVLVCIIFTSFFVSFLIWVVKKFISSDAIKRNKFLTIGAVFVVLVVIFFGLDIFYYLTKSFVETLSEEHAKGSSQQTQLVQTPTDNLTAQPSGVENAQDFSFAVLNKNITIRDKSGNLIQTIPLTSDAALSLNNSVDKIVSLKDDINFDGYKDLEVVVGVPADNPEIVDFYIYNSAAGKFDKDPILHNLFGPSFNSATKTITTSYSGGCAGADGESDTYFFLNGKYVLTLKKGFNCCSQDGNVTVETLVNGKMQTSQERCPNQ